MTPEEELSRGGRAAQLLEEPLIQEAFSILEAGYLRTIQTSAFKDQELRERCCQLLMNLSGLKQHLQSTMETGKMAAMQAERKKVFGIFG